MASGGRARVESVLQVLGVRFNPENIQGWLWGLCPYHDDEKPSWRIRVTAERYGQHYCFACKEGGTLVELVSHVRNVSIADALTWLDEFADKVPVIQEELVPLREELVQPRAPFSCPPEIIFDPLDSWVTPARAYLRMRAVSAAQVKCFRIGYAVDGRLAGRIVMPTWRRRAGELVMQAYQARDFTGHRKARRYLYPSSDDNANLDVMFGEHTWPGEGERGQQTLVVTEGAFNALAVDRVSTAYVAALGGSDIRGAFVSKIATFGRVLVFTDSDRAGDQAAEELVNALSRHTLVKRVRIPDDPGNQTGKKSRDANDLSPGELQQILCGAFLTFTD